MRWLLSVLLVSGCASQPDDADAGYFATPTVACCTPSPAPECCMQLGGIQIDHTCDLTCNLPDPSAPGWAQTTDTFGCPIWKRPVAPFACGGADSAVSCAPRDTVSYSPQGLVPPRPTSSSCTQTDLENLYDACIGPASAASSCYAQRQAATSCAACLFSQRTDSTWGAIVTSATVWDLNVSGCTALVTGDASTTSCAARIAAATGCEEAACQDCPFTPGSTTISRAQCMQAADVAACRAYVDAECDPADAGFSACRVNVEDPASFIGFARVFCGP